MNISKQWNVLFAVSTSPEYDWARRKMQEMAMSALAEDELPDIPPLRSAQPVRKRKLLVTTDTDSSPYQSHSSSRGGDTTDTVILQVRPTPPRPDHDVMKVQSNP